MNPDVNVKGKNGEKGPSDILEQLTKPLAKENPYLHMLLFGPMGGGKSYLSAQCVIGLYKWRRENQAEKRPILLVNTEESARWLFDDFEMAKVPVRLATTKSPADLVRLMDAVRDGAAAGLIVDSITHHWYNFVAAYKQRYNVKFMSIEHWGRIIPEWRELFSGRLIHAPYDYFLCGRSGFEYTMEKDEDTGKKTFYKSGVKAKIEGETGYEPDLCIYTQRIEDILEGRPEVCWEATVVKSRHKDTSGKTFRNAGWKDFAPAFFYLLNGSQPSVSLPEGDSGSLFGPESNGEIKKQKEIILEKIEGLLVSIAPGSSAREKKWKTDILEEIFGSRSWKEIQTKPPKELQVGLDALEKRRQELEAEFSQT